MGIEPGQVVDWRYGLRDDLIEQSVAQVHEAGGLCVAAHPHAPYPSGAFVYPFQGFNAVEVWNGRWSSDLPWNADNEAALAEWGRGLAAEIHRGRWRPAIGNSDGLRTGGEAAVVKVKTSGVPSGTVTLHTDRGRVHRDVLSFEGSNSMEWSTSVEESAFVRVEVRHPTGHMAAVTNPIILT